MGGEREREWAGRESVSRPEREHEWAGRDSVNGRGQRA